MKLQSSPLTLVFAVYLRMGSFFAWPVAYAQQNCSFDVKMCGRNVAVPGKRYGKNEILCSTNKAYQFGIANDGDLVLCKNDVYVWRANACCSSNAPYFTHQTDGNIVVYDVNVNGVRTVLWSSETALDAPQTARLFVRNRGVAVLVSTNNSGRLYWSTSPNSGTNPGEPNVRCSFTKTQCIGNSVSLGSKLYDNDHICSPNKRYKFGLDSLGNLILCDRLEVKWSRKAVKPALLILQHDGNLLLKSKSNQIFWVSSTAQMNVENLTLGNNGKLDLLTESGNPAWSISANAKSCTFGETLCKGTTAGLKTRFEVNDHLCSSNKQFKFGLDSVGNLVLCEGTMLKWSIKATNPTLALQRDGNFVLKSNSNVVWTSNSSMKDVVKVVVTTKGTVSLVKEDDSIVWSVSAKPNAFEDDDDDDEEEDDNNGNNNNDDDDEQAYVPGDLFYERKSNLYLSKGLTATRFGKTGEKVTYANGQNSSQRVHDQPDAGACFDTGDGGFIYVSNEEISSGGVGAFKFDANGEVVDYKMILRGTRRNCGGGKTPWGTWITGEEAGNRGFFYEVHPTGKWSQKTKIATQGGNYESATFDDRNMRALKVFGTNDKSDGELTRFAPNPSVLDAAVQSGNYRNVLTGGGGFHDYLVLKPRPGVGGGGTFRWTANKESGKSSARQHFPNAEGIDHHNGSLFFVSKKLKRLFVLDLDRGTYEQRGTSHGTFNGQPDQILHAVDPYNKKGLIYFTEDGGKGAAGIFAQDMKGRKLTIMEGGKGLSNESTGFAICDRGTKLIVAFQDEGFLYLIRRLDGKRFEGNTVNLKYHNAMETKVSDT